MSNEITAYFKGRTGVAESVYQNDYGIIMVFDGIDLPAHFDCYFSILNQDEAVPGVGADNRVAIPNTVLANPGNVTTHIPLHTGENDSEVEYVVTFKVIGRARPIDDGTPEQMTAVEHAIALLNEPISNIEDIVNEALSFTGTTLDELKAADAVINSRIDAFTHLEEGSTTGDAELIDGRVGADGTTYTNIGGAIRGQATILKNEIDFLSMDITQITNPTTVDWSDYATSTRPTGWRSAYYSSSDGSMTTSYRYLCSNSKVTFSADTASIYAKAPDGYGIRITEFNEEDVMVANYGSALADETQTPIVRISPKDGFSYGFTVGRFADNDSDDYNTEEFVSSIVVTAIADTIGKLEEFIDDISVNAIYDWSDIATTEHPTGWRKGYYSSADGTFASSNKYLASNSGITARANTASLNIEVPIGYGVRVSEYDSANNFIMSYGDSKTNLTNSVALKATSGHSYKFTIGRFSNDDAEEHNTSEFISDVKLTIKQLKSGVENKKAKSGDFEFFSVDVSRPLAFGEEEIGSESESVECVLRLPSTYSTTGTPTRLILACHGASGYISESATKWYNSNWKAFMDALLDAGYAVFDANVLPTSTGTDQMGFAVGSPLYVNVLKKAYDYIQRNYNVYPEILAHGTSMGGVGASAFVNAYPSLVLAESSFAGRDVTQYIKAVMDGDYDADDTLAIAWGYESTSDLKADKWSHIVGSAPSLSLRKYSNGVVSFAPDREADFDGWLAYYAEVQNHLQADTIGDYTAFRNVPYKSWDSWNDNVGKTKAKLILKKAFTYGGTAPYEVVVYDNATHTELSYGQVNDMIPQLIAWYKRWE